MTNLVRPLAPVLQAIEVLLRLGQLELAQQALGSVAQLHPDLVALHLLRGWLQLAQDEPQRAVATFRLAAARDPIDPFAWHGVAESTRDANERATAADRARLLSIDGPQAQLWHDLYSGRAHLVVTPLHALTRREPERPELMIWLAEAHRRLGNEQQARLLIEPLLRRRPRAVPALFLAATLAQDGITAEQLIQEALRFDPLGLSIRRLCAPDPVPFQLPPVSVVTIPEELAETIDTLIPPEQPVPRLGSIGRPGGSISVPKRADGVTRPAPTNDPVFSVASGVDDDSVAALSAVERAAERLFSHTPLAADAESTMALLITHYGALANLYGPGGAGAIVEAMELYAKALQSRNILAECVIIDDRAALTRFGHALPTTDRSPAACKQVIDSVRGYLEAQGRTVEVLVLIGGDTIIPFHRLPNPSQDTDPHVPSDNPYGCGSGSELAPEVIVARFPDGGADDARLLLAQLQRSIEYHHHWHLEGPRGGVLGLPLMRRFTKGSQAGRPVVSWALSAEAWLLPSQAVYEELGSTRPLLLCPPTTPDIVEASWPSDGRLLYFNIHGIQGGPNWYGQAADGAGDAPLPVALTPDDIGAVAPGMICISEACFGAEIVGRSPNNAIALRLLQSGALAFVGSTVTAYGAVTLPLGGADLLTQQAFQNLRRGYPLGRAIMLARDWMARECVQRQGYLDPDDAKTLLSFVLLGDPWATPYARPILERKAAPSQLTPILVQRRPVAANLVAPAAINVARQLIAKVAPQLSRAKLSVVGQGRVDRITKGQASAVVFSASEALPTMDGHTLAQIARVTVAGGEARKLLLSR